MTSPRFIFMGNGVYENRGCEAIPQGTLRVLAKAFGEFAVVDAGSSVSRLPQADDLDGIEWTHRPVPLPPRWSLTWFRDHTLSRISLGLLGASLYGDVRLELKRGAAALSLGGDNYSLDYGIPRRFLALGKFVKRCDCPLVVWGASIGPFDDGSSFSRAMLHHLREDVDLVLVRESSTYEYLQGCGVTRNLVQTADPAFVMEPRMPSDDRVVSELPRRFVAVNLSAMMSRYVTGGNDSAWRRIAADIVLGLLKRVDLRVVLVPHVMPTDYAFLSQVREQLGKLASRTVLLPCSLTARELKWVIAQACCFVGSRTHATIASFSSGVPTLSLGYSVKARGLTREMYGTSEYLLEGGAITHDAVAKKVLLLTSDATRVRAVLLDAARRQTELALAAGVALRRCLERLGRV